VIDKPIESKRGVELGSSLSYCPIQSCDIQIGGILDAIWNVVHRNVDEHLNVYIGNNARALITDSIWDSVRTNVQQECREYEY
jgi:hypothetical protein